MSNKKQGTDAPDQPLAETEVQDPLKEYLLSVLKKEPEHRRVSLNLIDFDPKNRKYFKEKGLEELAANIALHDVIQEVILSPKPDGRFMLAAGERRCRAAKIAGLTDVPACIAELNEAEARRVRFTENAFREDPHWMDEADLIQDMMADYQFIDEVAARLGKPKGFVYSRMKLSTLIDPIREMCIAGKFNIQQAFDVALLAPESQSAFFDAYCSKWQEKDFRIYDLQSRLNEFKYRLKDAPFNTRAKTLIEGVGACTTCEFNSAVLKSLFPESETDNTCLKRDCFDRKCAASFLQKFSKAVAEVNPQGLVFYGSVSQKMEDRIALLPDAVPLPRFNYYNVRTCAEPPTPQATDFPKYWEGQTEPATDEDAFSAAKEQHAKDLTEYRARIEAGEIKIGLLVTEDKIEPLHFTAYQSPQQTTSREPVPESGLTAKDVQEHIKAGTVTAPMLQEQVGKSKARETRNQELDREKVHASVHEGFDKFMEKAPAPEDLTSADRAAACFLVYQAMDYGSQQQILRKLFSRKKTHEMKHSDIYERFTTLQDKDLSFMVRMALLHHNSAKNPKEWASQFLYKTAEEAGFDVAAVEKAQTSIAKKRQKNLKKKLFGLNGMIKKLAA